MAAFWNPPVELSEPEERIAKLCKKCRLFDFFRRYRHEIFDEATQREMIEAYDPACRGKDAIAPAQLGMAMLMQAAFGVSDQEVPVLTVVDARWQMVLDCLGSDEPLFSQGTVFNYRMRAIAHRWERILIERTVQLARQTKAYSAARLRAALDSSPLWGAGRVEDTFNLIARAASQVVQSAAKHKGVTPEQLAEEAGIPLVNESSVKAALDLNWSDRSARKIGLDQLLGQVAALKRWLETELADASGKPPLSERLATLDRLVDQDTEPDPDGGRRIRQGVATDRQISVSDPDMRHGRKSSSKRFNGYKRHIAADLDIPGLIHAVALTPANEPEANAAEQLIEQMETRGDKLAEIHVDRAYVSSAALTERRGQGLTVIVKPHPVARPGIFSKADFSFDFRAMTLMCPSGEHISIRLGKPACFPKRTCDACSLRSACTKSATRGRQVAVNIDEPFQHELRAQQSTAKGRATLRKRVVVEHRLARIGQTQGIRARYKGRRKNEFDLGRHAVVNNCYLLDSMWREAA
jgi:hypothetical protein